MFGLSFLKKDGQLKANQLPQPQIPSIPSPNSNTSSLAAESEMLKTILAAIRDGVIAIDSQGKIIFANNAVVSITGYNLSELLNQNIGSLLKAEDQQGKNLSVISYCQASYDQKNHLANIPIALTLFGKETKKSHVELIPVLTDHHDSGLYCVLIIHDLTQETDFQEMQVDFVSMASHEFRTPLTSINNYLSVLQEELGPTLKADHQELLNRALASAKQLSILIENLLNVSKIERGSLAITLTSVDWAKTLQEIVENSKTVASKKNIELTLRLPESPLPKVTADPTRMSEVLNNLIGNAINYTQEGGKIEVGPELRGKEIVTYIKDTGMGIPQDAIPHLFNKFYRAPGALKKMNEGSGLGLYISKSIVDLHHGKIWVESKEGQGSTFYFSLPTEEFLSHPSILKLEH